MWPTTSPPAAFRARRERLAQGLDRPALFFSGRARPRNFAANRYPFRAESHFLYFVGRSLEESVLVVRPDGATLFASPPDPEEALWSGPKPTLASLSEALEIEVRPIVELAADPGAASLPVQDYETAFLQSELLGRDIEPSSGPDLEGADLALAERVIRLRLTHDEAAIVQLREAAAVTARAHAAGMRATTPGLKEASVLGAMEREITACGQCHAYGPIVTVHGEVLHDESHHRELRVGDLLLADVGSETPEGWAADVTRTWPVTGRFTDPQRAIYDVVLRAQAAAISAVRPGVRYLEVHRTAGRTLLSGLIELGILRGDLDDLYARGAHALFFPHGIGHLLGLDVHDMEDLGDRAGYQAERKRSENFGDRYLRLDRDLEPGMLVTIEPGFYRIPYLLERPEEVLSVEDALDRTELERYAGVRGIRIEDDVLVTADGCEVLTAAIPKTADAVERAVRE
jgi:Xaa-Pro aminopeptidase